MGLQIAGPTEIIEHEYSPEDLQDALQYLLWRDEGKTIRWIAEQKKVTDRMIYYRIERWEKNGALKAARAIFLVPRAEEISVAIDEAIREFPAIIRRLIHVARDSKSDFMALEATKWLFDNFVRPALESKIPEGTLEAAYAKRKNADFDPLSLVATVKIKDVRVSRLDLDEE